MASVSGEDLVAVGAEAAVEAGVWLRERFGGLVSSSRKADGSVVTEFDALCERMIASRIRASYPNHAIIGEELSPDAKIEGITWAVDPIDGTRNFASAVPLWAVSVAAVEDGSPVAAAIYIPVTDELYTAASGGGTRLGGEPISVGETASLDKAVAMTDLLPSHIRELGEEYTGKLVAAARRTRMLGSVCCSLAYVAGGRFDIYFRPHAHLWDVAAGVLLVREAGGEVSSLEGDEWTTASSSILAANSALVRALLARKREL